jgi:antitoxin component YwqK of YwqJK toxin-antitoxin module
MGEEGSVKRVPDSELDYDADLTYTHGGVLFTGIAYEEIPGGGISEVSYRNGMQDGVSRDWYPSGALKGEASYRENVQHGPMREYDEQGVLVHEAVYEFGILISSVKRDASGQVLESFEIDEGNPNFALLERFRRSSGG